MHQPPLNKVQLGVHILFTTGQTPSQPSAAPLKSPITPAVASHLILAMFERALRSTPPAIKPRIIVPRVGIKLSVAYPPSLKAKGFSRGNKFKNQVSNAHARLLFLFQCAAKPLSK